MNQDELIKKCQLTDEDILKLAEICLISGSYQGTQQRLEAMGFLVRERVLKLVDTIRLQVLNEVGLEYDSDDELIRYPTRSRWQTLKGEGSNAGG